MGLTDLVVGVMLFGAGIAVGYTARDDPTLAEAELVPKAELFLPKEESGNSGNSTRDFVGPRDIALDYVIAPPFAGVVISDLQTGQQGFLQRTNYVVTKGTRLTFHELPSNVLGQRTVLYRFPASPEETAGKGDQPWGSKRPSDGPSTHYQFGEGIFSFFRKADKMIYEKTR